jgi:hypothetical protein
MADLKPIETRYKGYRFRSRLEARWAVFFDALGIEWEYEKEGYDLGEAGWYLPDFWLPGEKLFVEVKPEDVDDGEVYGKPRELSTGSKQDVLVVIGTPGNNLDGVQFSCRAKRQTVYLAGKVGKNGWRHDVVDGLRQAAGLLEQQDPQFKNWPVLEQAIFGYHHYSGPHFMGCDHGCYHGPGTHGAGGDGQTCGRGDGDIADRRWDIRQACLSAIDRSDVVFAWIDAPDCYGTIAEIGYAYGRDLPVFIAYPEPIDDMWFPSLLCTWRDVCERPADALKRRVPTEYPKAFDFTPTWLSSLSDSERTTAAAAARSARFEHGERG